MVRLMARLDIKLADGSKSYIKVDDADRALEDFIGRRGSSPPTGFQ
jgi:hypothetical protein